MTASLSSEQGQDLAGLVPAIPVAADEAPYFERSKLRAPVNLPDKFSVVIGDQDGDSLFSQPGSQLRQFYLLL